MFVCRQDNWKAVDEFLWIFGGGEMYNYQELIRLKWWKKREKNPSPNLTMEWRQYATASKAGTALAEISALRVLLVIFTRQGGYIFTRRLFICLFVCLACYFNNFT